MIKTLMHDFNMSRVMKHKTSVKAKLAGTITGLDLIDIYLTYQQGTANISTDGAISY